MRRSPLLSAVVPVVIYGLRLTLDLPWQSSTANNLMRTGECVINLPGADTIAVVEGLARTVTSINKNFDFNFSRAAVCGTLTPAHMTLVPSETISALRALECPMQLETRIDGSIDTMDYERIAPLDKFVTFGLNVLRVHLDPSVVLCDVHPNMWTPLMNVSAKLIGDRVQTRPWTELVRSPGRERRRALLAREQNCGDLC
jgi:flavin reductase (DIM6/NTAB) family NADH-FMN oxidoreductase RutF